MKQASKIKKEDISQFFPNVEKPFFTDASYSMFTKDFLLGDGYNGYKKWLGFAGIKSKSGALALWKNSWDCDNLSFSFRTYMNMLHARENTHTFTERFNKGVQNASDAEGVAIGVIFYEIRKNAHHAINVAITTSITGDLVPLFIEPNNGAHINFSQEQKDSIWYVNF